MSSNRRSRNITEGVARAPNRSMYYAMGYVKSDFDKPMIGVANGHSTITPCNSGLQVLADEAIAAIKAHGGNPQVFGTPTISDGMSMGTEGMKYSLVSREVIADCIETAVQGQWMDGVLVIGGCDKTLPAQIMAAVSADLPTVVVPVGPMVVGHHKGEVLGACTDCRRIWGKYRAGEIDDEEIEAARIESKRTLELVQFVDAGDIDVCVTEALGLSLPMSATIPAPHSERVRSAELSGRRAAEMAVAGGPRPSELLTPAALRNAQVVMQAIGGSTNGLIHLTAIASRTPHRIDLEAFDQLGLEVPVLVDLKPSGAHYMEHFHHAGGVPKLMKELGGLIDLDARTVAGGTLRVSRSRNA